MLQGVAPWRDKFGYLANTSRVAQVVTGYVSNESLTMLRELLEGASTLKRFDLIVGMARFDGLSRGDITALEKLATFLKDKGLGDVFVALAIPVHAKVAIFTGLKGEDTALVGSSNLSGLEYKRQTEFDLYLDSSSSGAVERANQFVQKCLEASAPLSQALEHIPIIRKVNSELLEQDEVTKVTLPPLDLNPSKSFKLLLKANDVAEKSNLNKHLGSGRKGKGPSASHAKREWYEIEVIVGKHVTKLPGYPKQVITVVTDDGYEFPCHSSGQNNKNFESDGNLKVLGYWLKNRLVDAGVLEYDAVITPEVLKSYGTNFLLLAQFNGSDKWYLSFDPEQGFIVK